MKIIGISGSYDNGKDTVANILVEAYGYTRVAFADPLKAIALAADPYIRISDCHFERLSALVESVGWDVAKSHEDCRRFLQRLGTEAMRTVVDDNFWIDQHKKNSAGLAKVVVSDLRFYPNEYNYIKDQGGVVLRVVNPLKRPKKDHVSEQSLDDMPYDHLIINDSSFAVLKDRVLVLGLG